MELDKAKRKTWATSGQSFVIRGIAQQSRMTQWVAFGSTMALKPVNPPKRYYWRELH